MSCHHHWNGNFSYEKNIRHAWIVKVERWTLGSFCDGFEQLRGPREWSSHFLGYQLKKAFKETLSVAPFSSTSFIQCVVSLVGIRSDQKDDGWKKYGDDIWVDLKLQKLLWRFKKQTFLHPTCTLGDWMWEFNIVNDTHRHVTYLCIYYLLSSYILIDLISLSDWGYTLGQRQSKHLCNDWSIFQWLAERPGLTVMGDCWWRSTAVSRDAGLSIFIPLSPVFLVPDWTTKSIAHEKALILCRSELWMC